jgi:hypothetical protein
MSVSAWHPVGWLPQRTPPISGVGQVILAADDRDELAAALAEIRRTLVVLTQPTSS